MERVEVQGGVRMAAPGQTGALPPCELRRAKHTAHGTELICGAADVTLGELGRDDAAIAAVCRACPVPEALADRWACLHLRPVRLLEDGRWQAFFTCRWFYRLNPQRQPRSLQEQCYGCPYWFPRPDVTLMPGYWEETRQIRATVAKARGSCPPNPSPPAPSPAPGRGAGSEGQGADVRVRPSPGFWRWLWSRLVG